MRTVTSLLASQMLTLAEATHNQANARLSVGSAEQGGEARGDARLALTACDFGGCRDYLSERLGAEYGEIVAARPGTSERQVLGDPVERRRNISLRSTPLPTTASAATTTRFRNSRMGSECTNGLRASLMSSNDNSGSTRCGVLPDGQ